MHYMPLNIACITKEIKHGEQLLIIQRPCGYFLPPLPIKTTYVRLDPESW